MCVLCWCLADHAAIRRSQLSATRCQRLVHTASVIMTLPMHSCSWALYHSSCTTIPPSYQYYTNNILTNHQYTNNMPTQNHPYHRFHVCIPLETYFQEAVRLDRLSNTDEDVLETHQDGLETHEDMWKTHRQACWWSASLLLQQINAAIIS